MSRIRMLFLSVFVCVPLVNSTPPLYAQGGMAQVSIKLYPALDRRKISCYAGFVLPIQAVVTINGQRVNGGVGVSWSISPPELATFEVQDTNGIHYGRYLGKLIAGGQPGTVVVKATANIPGLLPVSKSIAIKLLQVITGEPSPENPNTDVRQIRPNHHAINVGAPNCTFPGLGFGVLTWNGMTWAGKRYVNMSWGAAPFTIEFRDGESETPGTLAETTFYSGGICVITCSRKFTQRELPDFNDFPRHDAAFIQTVSHELGHALGLLHRADRNSLMFDDLDSYWLYRVSGITIDSRALIAAQFPPLP